MTKFELTEDQQNKFDNWYKKLKKKDFGAIGGGLRFIFEPTGLGAIITVEYGVAEKSKDVKTLDLTDDNW